MLFNCYQAVIEMHSVITAVVGHEVNALSTVLTIQLMVIITVKRTSGLLDRGGNYRRVRSMCPVQSIKKGWRFELRSVLRHY